MWLPYWTVQFWSFLTTVELCRVVTGSELQDGEWMVEADGSKEEKLGAWTTVLAGVLEGSGGDQRHIENRISWSW